MGKRPPANYENTTPAPEHTSEPGDWSAKYGIKHRLQRIKGLPPGIIPPRRVRIYLRSEHYVLQWWDPAARTNLSDRVDGDLVAAINRARQIEERLDCFKSAQQISLRRLGHAQLVEAFLADLQQRANAGEIDTGTKHRYDSALKHYLAFCEDPTIARTFPHATGVNRDFRLKLAAFLAQRQVSPNGRNRAAARPMKGQSFVLETVRAMYEWAVDPERGQLLPDGFRNPFIRLPGTKSVLKCDPLAEPDITPIMAIDFIAECDRFQLRLFVAVLLFGLRAAEPCFLFAEYVENDWLRVPCNPDLAYLTKGRREKRFPLLDDLSQFWQNLFCERNHGLLFERRAVSYGIERAPLRGESLATLVTEYRRRCMQERSLTATTQKVIRDQVLKDAGGITYDQLQGEFEKLSRRLNWPRDATLKDLRHLFATTMNNAAMPESYRCYLMGHSPSKAALAAYTHLNELKRHYADAVRREWTPLLEAIQRRIAALLSDQCQIPIIPQT